MFFFTSGNKQNCLAKSAAAIGAATFLTPRRQQCRSSAAILRCLLVAFVLCVCSRVTNRIYYAMTIASGSSARALPVATEELSDRLLLMLLVLLLPLLLQLLALLSAAAVAAAAQRRSTAY